MQEFTGMTKRQLDKAKKDKSKREKKDKILEDEAKELSKQLTALKKANEDTAKALKAIGQSTSDNPDYQKRMEKIEKIKGKQAKIVTNRAKLGLRQDAKTDAREAEGKKKESWRHKKMVDIGKGSLDYLKKGYESTKKFAGKSLMGALTVIGLLALVKFLDSDMWKKMKQSIAKFDFQAVYDKLFGEGGTFPKLWEYFFEKEKGLFPRLGKAFKVFQEEGFLAGVKNLWDGMGTVEKIIVGVVAALIAVPVALTAVAFATTVGTVWKAFKGIKAIISGWGKGAGNLANDPAFKPPGGKPGSGKGGWFKGIGKKFLKVLRMFRGKKGVMLGLVAAATGVITWMMNKTSAATDKIKNLKKPDKVPKPKVDVTDAKSVEKARLKAAKAEKLAAKQAKASAQKLAKAQKVAAAAERTRLGMSRGGGGRGYAAAVKNEKAARVAAKAAEKLAAKQAAEAVKKKAAAEIARKAELARKATIAAQKKTAELAAKAEIARKALLLKEAAKKTTSTVAQTGAKSVASAGAGLVDEGGVALAKGTSKALGKGIIKGGAKAGGKMLLRALPGFGLLAGLFFAGERALAGDFTGASMELAAGAAALLPVGGTAASIAISAAIMAREMGAFAKQEGEMAGQIEAIKSKIKGTKAMMAKAPTLRLRAGGPKTKQMHHLELLKLQKELEGLQGEQGEMLAAAKRKQAAFKAEVEAAGGQTVNVVKSDVTGDSYSSNGGGSVVDGDYSLMKYGSMPGYDD
ncbi:uncharacterized protein METZ01_LOCUS128329 [marine metagenome]|uniref:Phage tail tape measure protein domain-containing protein n=1 Tax=marine metagenome TaxID=408172 RepID=A0A381YEQ0_9ZZZZ